MGNTFKKAVKTESYLRMALAGPSGSGKTYTALTLATVLAGDLPIAVIDTERGSASKYADLFEFDVLELDDFHPDRYVEAIQTAAQEGYGVVVIDSLSHAWNGANGLLEQVEAIGKRKYNGNSFKAWGDVKPAENRLVGAITGSAIHVIATMRSKTEYVVEQNERGKATPRKVGTAPVQRDGFEYEFDVFGEMTPDNELLIQKTRCPALTGQVISKPGAGLAQIIGAWLHGAPQPQLRIVTPPTPATEPKQPSEQPDLIARALRETAILQLLNKLGLRLRDRQRDKLIEIKAGLDAIHKTFNGENVTAELQRQINVMDACEPAALEGVDMGAPGN